MGFFSKLIGGTVKIISSPLEVTSGIINGETDDIEEGVETGIEGVIDVVTSPLSLLDDEDD